MRTDANTLPQGSRLKADICIIGAGAAGISLALGLEGSGLSVILLESGTDEPNANAQTLYSGTVEDPKLHSAPDTYRVRRFGGSTTLWGGRCMPMDPIDFEPRDYIPHSGWPMPFEELQRYYPRANQLCEAGEYAYTAQQAFPQGMAPMIEGLAEGAFDTDHLERFSCPTNFGARYQKRLERAGTHVILNANFSHFESTDNAKQVGAAVVRTLKSICFFVQARCYVIATGGLETARLLLSMPGSSGQGLGNAHDIVGRYYMCHLAGTIGTVDLSPATSVHHGYQIADDGVYCRRRLALRPKVQREHDIGNFVARLHHPRITDPGHGIGVLSLLYVARPGIPYEYAKRLYEDSPWSWPVWRAHLRNIFTDIPGTVSFLNNWLIRRTLAERKFPSIIVTPRNRRYSLDFHAEQVPCYDSKVSLGNDTDALGMRRIHIDWRYTQKDVETVRVALALLAQQLQASGVGHFEYDPELVETEMTRYGAYGGHHIGTARMGVSPLDSVVDTNCKLHEADNVYLAGSAVFPTSSQANPTLTISALSLRLADHLHSVWGDASADAQIGATSVEKESLL